MGIKELMTGYGGLMFPLPSIAGSCKGKNIVVCGDASCVWDDLEKFGCADTSTFKGRIKKDGWEFMAINKIGETFPGHLHHWYSNQPNYLNTFIAARRPEYAPEFSPFWVTHSCNSGADYRWPWHGGGTSGLGGTLVAVALGYDRVMLCGLPLDDSPHNGEPHWRKSNFTREASGSINNDQNTYWKRAIAEGFDGKVKSMSGRTKEWMGAP